MPRFEEPRFEEIVGRGHVLTDPAALAPYCTDWTGRFRGSTPVVVRPGSAAEVAGVVNLCREHGLSIVPQGGNTGLVGGSVPLAGEVVVSLRRLRDGVPGQAGGGRLTVGAGTTLAAVHAAASAAGWAYGVDFASREGATLGGTIATDAAGFHALRHGSTRQQLVGVEAVLGDGTLAAGAHLAAFVCASEGTLGIVTSATVRLVPRAEPRVTTLLGFDDPAAAIAAAVALHHDLSILEAAELLPGNGIDLVCQVAGLPQPLERRHPAYLLVEAAGPDVPFPPASAGRDTLWRYREALPAAIGTLGTPHKLDVALPTGALAEFIAAVPPLVAAYAPGARTWIFGHAAVGNIHVNVTGLAPDDERVDDAVLRLAVDAGGSISAEHGIGTAKRRWVHLSRTEAELAALRAVKRQFDPDGILNPNVLLPPA